MRSNQRDVRFGDAAHPFDTSGVNRPFIFLESTLKEGLYHQSLRCNPPPLLDIHLDFSILTEMKPFSEWKNSKGETVTTGIVFQGSTGGAMSAMTLTMQMRRMEKGHYTIHGFRSAFRDWVGDETSFSETLAEHALAHKIGDDTEIAYRRKYALERRRKLMEAWAAYIEPKAPDSNIIPIRQA